jgi:hypothetical protein
MMLGFGVPRLTPTYMETIFKAGFSQASAPPQLLPAPAVQPRQWESTVMVSPARFVTSISHR